MLGSAQALDLISTAAAIDQGHMELNPMTAAVLAFGGFVFLVVGKGVTVLLTLAIGVLVKHAGSDSRLVGVVAGFILLVAGGIFWQAFLNFASLN